MKKFFASVVLAMVGLSLFPFAAFAATPKPSCILYAPGASSRVGNTVNLSWQSSNATGGTITTIGSVGQNGIQGVIPLPPSSTYVGTFTGPGGTGTCSIAIAVLQGGGYSVQNYYGDASLAPSGSFINVPELSSPPSINAQTSVGTPPPLGEPATIDANNAYNGGSLSAPPGTSAPAPLNIPTASGSGGLSSQSAPSSGSTGGGLVTCKGVTDCNLCTFTSMLQRVINYTIGLSIPIAVCMFAYAAWLFFSNRENFTQITRAKKIFATVLIGFVIALMSWLMVQTILKAVVPGYASWNYIDVNKCTGNRLINGQIGTVLSQTLGTPQQGVIGVVNIPAQNQAVTNGVLFNDQTGCAYGSNWDATLQGCVNADGDVSAPVGFTGGIRGYTPPTSFSTCDNGDILQNGSCLDSFGDTYAPYAVTSSLSGPQGTCSAGYRYAQSADGSYEDWCQGPGGSDDVQDFVKTSATGPTVQCSGGLCSNIYQAALAYQGVNTSSGPDGGNKACAWAVNNILASTGAAPIDGNSVAQMQGILSDPNSGRGYQLDQSQAQPGDLVFYGGLSHVGVCANTGCTQTLSNSSSQAVFAPTGATGGIVPAGGSRFYHVNN